MVYTNNKQLSFLQIGATGETGLAISRKLASHESNPSVHAMVRDPTKLSDGDRKNFTSIVRGDALSAADIERALVETDADWLVISVGNGSNTKKQTTREDNAKAVVSVLSKPQFQTVRVMVMSSHGAGPTKVIFGFGIGMLITYFLKNVFVDHTNQEQVFLNSNSVKDRAVFVRPTELTNDKPTGNIQEFGNVEKVPSIHTDRADVAQWIVNEIYRKDGFVPRAANICSVKK